MSIPLPTSLPSSTGSLRCMASTPTAPWRQTRTRISPYSLSAPRASPAGVIERQPMRQAHRLLPPPSSQWSTILSVALGLQFRLFTAPACTMEHSKHARKHRWLVRRPLLLPPHGHRRCPYPGRRSRSQPHRQLYQGPWLRRVTMAMLTLPLHRMVAWRALPPSRHPAASIFLTRSSRQASMVLAAAPTAQPAMCLVGLPPFGAILRRRRTSSTRPRTATGSNHQARLQSTNPAALGYADSPGGSRRRRRPIFSAK